MDILRENRCYFIIFIIFTHTPVKANIRSRQYSVCVIIFEQLEYDFYRSESLIFLKVYLCTFSTA